MTNQVIETIKNRRSHRAYLQKQIRDEELQAILKSGYYAPSAHNHQSWRFTVIQNKELIDELSSAIKEAATKHMKNSEQLERITAPDFHIFYHAPTVVLVSGENSAKSPSIDCSAATENMLIAAESLNIGSCWIGFASMLFKDPAYDKFKAKLGILEDSTTLYAFTLGYKAVQNIEAKPRKENIIDYIK